MTNKQCCRLIIVLGIIMSSIGYTQTTDASDHGSLENQEWQLIWSDEFKQPSIDRNKWSSQVLKAGQFNDEWQRYTNDDKNAFIENDYLVIKAIHETQKHGLNQYTSARLHTAGKFSFTYGKVAARIKLPEGEGIWPAFWMLGANIDENGGDTPWPFCGEIDILELYGSKSDSTVEANSHFAGPDGKHQMMGAVDYSLAGGKFSDDFHIFELVWTSKYLYWYVDGYRYASTPIDAADRSEFHKPFFLLLNIAVGGTFAGRPDSSTSFPQAMYVDWIRVYQKK